MSDEVPKEYHSEVKVCAEEICTNINLNDVLKNGSVDKGLINMTILEDIYPFFENAFGGKELFSNSNGAFLSWKQDYIPDLSESFNLVYEAFSSNEDYVKLSVKDLPGTDGRFADKYIEIDNSKQKLYVWENGKVVNEILLSAAKEGYEVYGVFPIVDKGVEPIAPSGRYMPYWMAFYYSKSQKAWYGLHGLIWWYDENGKAVYEPDTNIGIRRSTGCIRMLKEDAKYLYSMFDKGDLILIHE